MTTVAIIGAGPRGLWAAEELVNLARERGVPVTIDVYDDGAPGPYDQDQPEEWLINVHSSIIRSQIGTFNQWRDGTDPFPSRRAVGEFLTASWDGLSHYLPPGTTLTHHHAHIDELTPVGEQWKVADSTYDEVLIATGHAGSLSHQELAHIGPQDRVLVRGAALTFIDVIRACSPEVFVPVSRSGRFMEVKPPPIDAPEIIEPGKTRIRDTKDFEELLAVLRDVAEQLLGHPSPDIDAVLAGTDGTDPVADLRASLEVVTDQRPKSAAWAVGVAWRDLYPAIVERASYQGRDSLPGFGELSRRLERVAFGPPPETAQHLLELLDAGVVDPSYLPRGNEPLEEIAQEAGCTVTIDAVITPPGVVPNTLCQRIIDAGYAQIRPGTRGLDVAPDGTITGQTHLAAVGRMTEDVVLGNDTLSRTLHDVIPRWARRVIPGPPHTHGLPPMKARLEPWAERLTQDHQHASDLIERFGSPVNVLDPAPMERNITELVNAGAKHHVEVKIFFARKANKGLIFVDTVRDTGHGVDVASERELRQVLDRGVPGQRIILSAAIKPDALLELAINNGVTISADSRAELDRISALANTTAFVAPRVAPDPHTLPPTRFGERSAQWSQHLTHPIPNVEIVGLHVHLHGYASSDRSTALRECFTLIDALRHTGHNPSFIDLGGGIPMSYLEDKDQWNNYHSARRAVIDGRAQPFTWKSDPLDNVYPFYQSPTRGEWLGEVLSGGIAEEFTSRGLKLHLEPGRSVLDGCGLILAEVAFIKERSDGVPLVGLAMNRTQCRTTSDDYLVDPILLKNSADSEELEAYLVGAYCIEDEVILRRRIRFPVGVAPGDIIAIPNTAGYFMHILESASHQIPLAKNIVNGELDQIDIK